MPRGRKSQQASGSGILPVIKHVYVIGRGERVTRSDIVCSGALRKWIISPRTRRVKLDRLRVLSPSGKCWSYGRICANSAILLFPTIEFPPRRTVVSLLYLEILHWILQTRWCVREINVVAKFWLETHREKSLGYRNKSTFTIWWSLGIGRSTCSRLFRLTWSCLHYRSVAQNSKLKATNHLYPLHGVICYPVSTSHLSRVLASC